MGGTCSTLLKRNYTNGHLTVSGCLFTTVAFMRITVTTITTAGNVSYNGNQTVTGFISRDPNGAPRTDSLPSATTIVNNVSQARNGDGKLFLIRNEGSGAETITLSPGAGVAINGSATISAGNARFYVMRINTVSPASVTFYALGQAPF